MVSQKFTDGQIAVPSQRDNVIKEPFDNLPINSRHPLRVVCIGSGYSGLMMAIVMTEKFRDANLEFQIYEKNQDLGGTWFVNRFVLPLFDL
jgi:ribulose 1,5-bisphosphate synthetase/thiazole synthase